MLCSLFCVIPPRLSFICRRFGTLPSSQCLNFVYRRFGTICSIFPKFKFYITDVSEPTVCSIFPRQNFMYRRFGTLCLLNLPGSLISYADVSEHPVPSSRFLNFIYRRFETLCCNFLSFEFYIPTFRNNLL